MKYSLKINNIHFTLSYIPAMSDFQYQADISSRIVFKICLLIYPLLKFVFFKNNVHSVETYCKYRVFINKCLFFENAY